MPVTQVVIFSLDNSVGIQNHIKLANFFERHNIEVFNIDWDMLTNIMIFELEKDAPEFIFPIDNQSRDVLIHLIECMLDKEEHYNKISGVISEYLQNNLKISKTDPTIILSVDTAANFVNSLIHPKEEGYRCPFTDFNIKKVLTLIECSVFNYHTLEKRQSVCPQKVYCRQKDFIDVLPGSKTIIQDNKSFLRSWVAYDVFFIYHKLKLHL